jgi:hypothetical protein
MLIIPAAIVKTIPANTQRGRYCSGPVRNSSELGDLAARAGPIRHRGLRRAAVDHKRSAHRSDCIRHRQPEDVGVLLDPFVVTLGERPRRRRALRDDHHYA